LNDRDGKRGWASALYEPGHFMPVDFVGDCFGNRLGHAEAGGLGHAPGVHFAGIGIGTSCGGATAVGRCMRRGLAMRAGADDRGRDGCASQRPGARSSTRTRRPSVVQAAVCAASPARALIQVGVAADGLHAASMMALAGAEPRLRRALLAETAIAAALASAAATGLRRQRGAANRVRWPVRKPGPSRYRTFRTSIQLSLLSLASRWRVGWPATSSRSGALLTGDMSGTEFCGPN
jgi:hypothetical protein